MKKTIAIPFTPSVNAKTGLDADLVAQQIEQITQQYSDEGWTYVGIESVSTTVEGSKYCFGFAAQPDTATFTQVIIFQK